MFSEKYGYVPQSGIVLEDISDGLRVRIWNLFHNMELIAGGIASPRLYQALDGTPSIEDIIADKLHMLAGSYDNGTPIKKIQNHIMTCPWYKVFDFVEIHLSCLDSADKATRIAQYNSLFEEEKSGYRVVAGEVVSITNPTEIECISAAASTGFAAVDQHITKAIALYGDLEKPDYENSIKESISAVEAMCSTILGTNATLGAALKKLEEHGIEIHNAMKNAFSSLYGYTSDEKGIRHGGMDFANAPAEDAKFMLVACSAFVNYLTEKWSKAKTEK